MFWESLYNPNFKVVEFDHFRKEAGLATFTMSVTNWVESTNAIGIFSRPGKNKAQKRIDEGYYDRFMYEEDKGKKLIVIPVK